MLPDHLNFELESNPLTRALTSKFVLVDIFPQVLSGVFSFEEFVVDVLFGWASHAHV